MLSHRLFQFVDSIFLDSFLLYIVKLCFSGHGSLGGSLYDDGLDYRFDGLEIAFIRVLDARHVFGFLVVYVRFFLWHHLLFYLCMAFVGESRLSILSIFLWLRA